MLQLIYKSPWWFLNTTTNHRSLVPTASCPVLPVQESFRDILTIRTLRWTVFGRHVRKFQSKTQASSDQNPGTLNAACRGVLYYPVVGGSIINHCKYPRKLSQRMSWFMSFVRVLSIAQVQTSWAYDQGLRKPIGFPYFVSGDTWPGGSFLWLASHYKTPTINSEGRFHKSQGKFLRGWAPYQSLNI